MKGETKFIVGTIIVSLVFIVGAYLLLSKTSKPSVPKEQILAENGLHWHPTLTITIKGEKQEIQKDIGIGAIHQPIHTHDASGVIHLEIQGLVKKDDTKLGNFFKNWGKKFSSTQIFDKVNGPEGKIRMLVNGKENKDFENYLMKDGDKIEIHYE